MKTALVHDWLVSHAGAEKVLESIHSLFPGPIHTLVHDSGNVNAWPVVYTSFLQKIPYATSLYRHLLPLFPLAIEQFDLGSYDLVLSSSHAVAKGVLTHTEQLHICYCHTPMRYAWDLYHPYLSKVKGIKKPVAKMALHYLRHWDSTSTSRVDHFIANSNCVARRIKKIYQRDAKVIHPPVATHHFFLDDKEDFYLTVSRLVPYKRVDLIVEAFAAMPEKKLLVVGNGPEMSAIKKKAKGNIELLGALPDEHMRKLMAQAKAFVFAAEEDFGIAPVEAQAAGTPVIAFGRGGVLETVVEGVTGLFFSEQTISSLSEAIQHFDRIQHQFIPEHIQEHAGQFSEERFKQEYRDFVSNRYKEFHENRYPCWR
ncbi:MAG: glycosyltransferase [Simkania sp.]|nr:glycosyltransferase [Simkania sp.]